MDQWTDFPRTPAMVTAVAAYVHALLDGQPVAAEAKRAIRELAEGAVQRGTSKEMSLHTEGDPARGALTLTIVYHDERGEVLRKRELRWQPKTGDLTTR